MKASEVLKRYAEGRRDFRGENLRGLSFRGKDLSGADFSEADIRGTNFRNATLRGTQFTKAKAGLQKRWVVVLLIVCFVLVVLSGGFCAVAGYAVADLLVNDTYGIDTRIAGWASILSLLGLCLFIIRQGLNSTFAIAIAIAIALAIFAIASNEVSGSSGLLAGIIASSITLILGLLSGYMSWRAIKGDEKYAFIRGNAVAIAAFGGTCFRDADLTDADFSAALLKNTNLKSEKLIRTCWRNAKKLDLARVGNTILSQPAIQELLTTGKGYRKSFVDFNLRGANLTEVDLSYANLRQADLSQAVLRGANLEGVNLTETNCVGADFTAATLTAACLEAWNIDEVTAASGACIRKTCDSTTILEQVNCDYVFLLEEPNLKTGSKERRPHDPDAVFQPGDFEKLYRQIMNTVEILLRNGMNPDAFKQAFHQLMAEHPEIDYNSIQSIEKKGEDVLIKIAVPEETDKGQVERQFLEVYEARLEAAKQTALLEAEVRHNQDLTEIIHQALLERSPSPTVNLNNSIQQETKTMSDNQEIQTGDVKGNFAGNVGGNFDASGAVFNIDNIKSQVSNSINELPPSPDPEQPGIKELLDQLQTAISESYELNDADKAQALEQIKTLAEAGQNPKDSNRQQQAKGALRFLKGLMAELPTVAKLVKQCQEWFPTISKFFGL